MKKKLIIIITIMFLVGGISLVIIKNSYQPDVVVRTKKIIKVGTKKFRDLNANGKLDDYEDWRLSSKKEQKIL